VQRASETNTDMFVSISKTLGPHLWGKSLCAIGDQDEKHNVKWCDWILLLSYSGRSPSIDFRKMPFIDRVRPNKTLWLFTSDRSTP